MKNYKYKTSLNGKLIKGETYKEVCEIIANSGLMSMQGLLK